MNNWNLITLLILLSIPSLSFSQNKIDIGVFLGYGEHGSDVHSWGRHGAMLTENSAFAYGANLKLNFKDNLGLRLNYWGSEISGQDRTLTELVGHDLRDYSFSSPLKELSLVLEYDLFGKKRWQNKQGESLKASGGSFRRAISPYFFSGVGLSFTNPIVDFGQNISKLEEEDLDNTETTNFQIPVGGGIRFDLTEAIYVSAEISSRIPINDYLEGISESANPEKNDSYQFIGFNLGFRIGGRDDSDNDGIIDKEDLCPNIPGLIAFNGCPDSDNDGIEDSKDRCPNSFGALEYMGCPDSDKDGVIDLDDTCPSIAGLSKFDGCPDTDGDEIPDIRDECPNEVGPSSNNGCPLILDADGDGFNDDVDNCPNVFGIISGCPDTDKDGVIDQDDACPTLFGTLNGCPDSDGDGIADHQDACPLEAGIASNSGCPQKGVSRSDIINDFYINDIYFDTNQSVIKSESRFRIEEVLAFSRQFPEAKFIITGHTDNRNSDNYNLNLSERRAKRVYESLVKAGVNPSKLTIEYKGEHEPATSNLSEEEMKKNRRVEIRGVAQ